MLLGLNMTIWTGCRTIISHLPDSSKFPTRSLIITILSHVSPHVRMGEQEPYVVVKRHLRDERTQLAYLYVLTVLQDLKTHPATSHKPLKR